MKKALIEIFSLHADATDEQIIAAAADARKEIGELKSTIAASKPSARELVIRQKMEKTGMTRDQAEHVVDQQTLEDKARAKASKKKDAK